MRRDQAGGVVAVVAALVVTGLIVNDPIVAGFDNQDLVAPSASHVVPWTSSIPGQMTAEPQTSDYTLTWNMSAVFVKYGGALRLSMKNDGPNSIFVRGFSFKWVGSEMVFSNPTSTLVRGCSSAELGVVGFSGPSEDGLFLYSILINLYVSTPDQALWHDFGQKLVATRTVKVDNFTWGLQYASTHNSIHLFNRVNSLVDFAAADEIAVNAVRRNPGPYSVWQILDGYEWVAHNIAYARDPGDYWQSPSETLSLRTGDCEDFALLICSMVGALGGNARLNLIDGHAFATVYVASSSDSLALVQEAVTSFYGLADGSLRIACTKDESGYWMVLDPLGSPYAGGLPAESTPTWVDFDNGSWTVQSTALSIADATGRVANWQV